jgi:hypothetical protein
MPIRGDVSQISPPIRILLVLAIAVMGVYMLFLRPKTEVVPPAEPAPNTQTGAPAVSQPGKIAEAAQGAVNAANGQLQSQESVDGVDAGESASATATTTETAKSGAAAAAAAGVDLKGLPKPVARAIRHNKTLVLLFWNGKSADDKAVHAALKKVDRWHGRVFVDTAPIKQIAKYGRIARGVDVEQSPTIVVADTDLHAETLVGYVDALTIDQAVVDAFRNTTGLFTDAYLRKVDKTCVSHSNHWAAVPYYWGGSSKHMDARLTKLDNDWHKFVAEFRAIKAPKKWSAFRTATAADLSAIGGHIDRFVTAIGPGTQRGSASANAAVDSFLASAGPVGKRVNHRFDDKGLFRCGSSW